MCSGTDERNQWVFILLRIKRADFTRAACDGLKWNRKSSACLRKRETATASSTGSNHSKKNKKNLASRKKRNTKREEGRWDIRQRVCRLIDRINREGTCTSGFHLSIKPLSPVETEMCSIKQAPHMDRLMHIHSEYDVTTFLHFMWVLFVHSKLTAKMLGCHGHS